MRHPEDTQLHLTRCFRAGGHGGLGGRHQDLKIFVLVLVFVARCLHFEQTSQNHILEATKEHRDVSPSYSHNTYELVMESAEAQVPTTANGIVRPGAGSADQRHPMAQRSACLICRDSKQKCNRGRPWYGS